MAPHANVSLAVNMRLYRRVLTIAGGRYLVPAVVTSEILNHPDVPVLMDVDGAAASARQQLPYYIAPPLDPNDPYGAGTYWFPAYRHQGSINVTFTGGHVLSSKSPVGETGWNWSYQPSE